MADLYGLEASGLPPELVAQLAGTQGRRKIAETMLQRGMSPLQVQSGVASWTQGLAQLLNAYAGRKGIDTADKEAQGIADARKRMVSDAMAEYEKRRMGVPEQTAPFEADTFPGEAPIGGLKTVTQKGVAPDREGAYRQAMVSSLPELQKVATTDFNLDAKNQQREDQQLFQKEQLKAQTEARAADRAAQNEAKIQMMRDQIASREAMGKDANDLRREIARMQADLQREVKMAGIEAKKVAEAEKKTAAEQAKTEGLGAVEGLIGEMRGYYDSLDKAKAITSTERGGISNAMSALQTSGLGQIVGRTVGTEEQSLRDSITQSRPLLLNAIRQATGMSAKALDSNAELQLFLRAATDPALGKEANMRALNNLEQFIVNKGKKPTPMAADGAPMPAKASSGKVIEVDW